MSLSIKKYIESESTLSARIEAIDTLISSMLLSSIDSIDESGLFSYSLDDGHIKVTTQFRSMTEVTNGIRILEQLRNIYANRADGGNITVLRKW